MEATPVEIRVLGCLIEKQRATPDQYPLSVNALRSACNQSTNRDPVLDLDETTVREAAQQLGRRGWARFTSGRGSRTARYRQSLDEALGLDGAELSVLAVLMLRGPQTPGELKTRTERLHPFADLAEVQQTVERLIERELVRTLERRPGQKEQRHQQLLDGGGDRDGDDGAPSPADPRPPTAHPVPPLEARVDELEREVAELRRRLDEVL